MTQVHVGDEYAAHIQVGNRFGVDDEWSMTRM